MADTLHLRRRRLPVTIVILLTVAGFALSGSVRSQGDTGNTSGATPPAQAQGKLPDLGPNARLNGWRPFPVYDAWNRAVDKEPVDPNSNAIIARIGRSTRLQPDFGANGGGRPFGIPYVVVAGTQPPAPIQFRNVTDSDPGPYPIPRDTLFEFGPASRQRLLIVDRDNLRLYEMRGLRPLTAGWFAEVGAIFDLRMNTPRPQTGESADQAGMPIFPGLVRYEEVGEQQEIRHALRFSLTTTRKAYVSPARRFIGTKDDASLPPLGMRIRLKANVDISKLPPQSRVIAQALKTYGMFLADEGGDMFLYGAPDERWSDHDLNALQRLKVADFEVIKLPPLQTK